MLCAPFPGKPPVQPAVFTHSADRGREIVAVHGELICVPIECAQATDASGLTDRNHNAARDRLSGMSGW